jgi:nicotinic acid mononucleotide adenylyltransferase
LVIATREGKDVTDGVKDIEETANVKVELLENQPFECSSTDFRAQPNADSLPDGVFEYIKKRGLYGL